MTILTFISDDEETPAAKMAELDLAEIAALMERLKPEGDAYDVLRDVLSALTSQARESRGNTH